MAETAVKESSVSNAAWPFESVEALTAALQGAVRAEVARHKREGHSIAIWRDGEVVILPPEEIPDWPEDAATL